MTAGHAKSGNLWHSVWKSRWQYVAISPFYVWFAIFGVYPLIYSLILSFHSWSGVGAWKPIGLGNYVDLFKDGPFIASLVNTVYYLAIAVPILVAGSLILAAIFNNQHLRFRGVYRTALFLPYITSQIIIAIVFISVFDKDFGLLNASLKSVGIPAVPWLVSTDWSKIAVLILFIWSLLGYYLIIMLAGLQSISQELYEAAAIDGATVLRAFVHLTVPLMRPVILFVTITTTIAVLNMFGSPFVLTGGGPQNSSVSMTLLLYQKAFRFLNYGQASAVAFIITIITVLIAVAQIYLLRTKD